MCVSFFEQKEARGESQDWKPVGYSDAGTADIPPERGGWEPGLPGLVPAASPLWPSVSPGTKGGKAQWILKSRVPWSFHFREQYMIITVSPLIVNVNRLSLMLKDFTTKSAMVYIMTLTIFGKSPFQKFDSLCFLELLALGASSRTPGRRRKQTSLLKP